METVGIRKLKRPRGYGCWRAYALARDEHGRWLYSPTGSRFRGSDGETVGECEVGQGDRDAGLPVLSLIPDGGWWIATWAGEDVRPGAGPVEPWISVDICTPPSLAGGEWTYVDLELDPHRTRAGRVWLEDADEFDGACRAGLISPAEERHARAATADILARLRTAAEPFGDVGWQRLDEATATGLAPV